MFVDVWENGRLRHYSHDDYYITYTVPSSGHRKELTRPIGLTLKNEFSGEEGTLYVM